ncbi:hypothetical protein HYE53_02035, partial [Aggregatibacter actinomycetemcomitans]|nr:hypothetical protein [Aggregatibacter actinomycetemcomitans]
GVIEVRRYNDGHIRADLSWVWFLCSIGFLVYDYFTSQSMFRDIQWVINPDLVLLPEYNEHLQIFNELGKSFRSYNEFKMGMLEKHWSNRYWGWFYILFP